MKPAAAWLALAICACGRGAPANAIPGDHGPALAVEVLNASGRPGEARVGTRLLRRAGIDVVFFGNATDNALGLDSTRIVVRRGTTQVGERVRQTLGVGRVEVQLDSSRLLDVSVLLGADFAAAGKSLDFHP
jgi:LytR cell envelope-related transcriptional attenuator